MKFSRAFNKRVDLWGLTSVDDGYGGKLVNEQYVMSVWANIKTVGVGNSYIASNFGVVNADQAVIFTFRKRRDINYNIKGMFIVYRDKRYTVATHPNNEDYKDNLISFIGIAKDMIE